ncbi:Poly(3-hydroxybutyrate) depolymerase-like protein [Parafrankia sp. EAN1pec]|nr:Poly(3-hydroxybutyrate) depolymerase-like protein [Frankia sp. EAN1pec]
MTKRDGPPRHRRATLLAAAALAVLPAASLVACGPGESLPIAAGGAGTTPGTGTGTGGAPTDGGTPSPGTALPVGRSTRTISVGGVQRTVHAYRPAGLTGPAPLVVMLHGGYGGGTQAEDSYHWDQAADRGRFVALFPDGTDKSWNAGGGCCGPAARTGVDDVAFLKEAVATVRRQTGIDPDRVYVSGVSNGGAMAYRMACETDLFAAVGVDSTTMLVDCAGAAPASVLHIHGAADPVIRYDGAPGEPYSPRSPAIDGPPVPDANAAWRRIDRCAPPRTTTSGVLTTSTATCPEGRDVELVTIAGAGHQWPGATPNPLAERLGAGTPSTALDATETIWRFFADHPRPRAATPPA